MEYRITEHREIEHESKKKDTERCPFLVASIESSCSTSRGAETPKRGKVGLIPIEGVFWDSMLKKF